MAMSKSVFMAVAETVTRGRATAPAAAAIAISAQGVMVVKASAGYFETADIAVCFAAVVGIV